MNKIKNTNFNIFLGLLFGLVIFGSFFFMEAEASESYPKLASHFLKWEILDSEVNDLARYDLITLDMETQTNSPEQIVKIRKKNPKIIILAYLNTVELLDQINTYNKAEMRNNFASGLSDNWWLRDESGRKISNWPFTSMFNLTDYCPVNSRGERFNDYLANFVSEKIKASGLWDGIFFDNTWGDVSWINGGNIDANNDGRRDNINEINSAWASGFQKMLTKTRQLVGSDFIIVGNGRVYEGYQKTLNGMMFENFPSPWESNGTWAGSMKTYLRLPDLNLKPNISIINSFSGNFSDYPYFRFSLGSALLGNGFFTFNYSTHDYSQSAWYDEYNINLGKPKSEAYNLLAAKSADIKPGLWRRDFQFGSVIINSTDKEQLHVFSKEEVEKIKGGQDPKFNTGAKISYIKISPQDGALLLRQSNVISGAPFVNGYFYRVYNSAGSQVRNGFFSYLNNFSGEAEVASFENLAGASDVSIMADSGEVVLYNDGQKINSFFPYTKNYREGLNMAVRVKDNRLDQIILGPKKGGPQVTIFSDKGRLLGSFFAYDKKFRGGVSVAIGDIDGDSQDEIITAPGKGMEPLIKIFSMSGVLKNSFLAYDKNFRGGVNIAMGDINSDGHEEIITGPISGGGPHVRVFNRQGNPIYSFFAYDKNYHGGIKVSTGDINFDGQSEILVGIQNFY